jgi:hypothetical protein
VGGFVQILSIEIFLNPHVIPPTGVGGYFKILVIRNLNNPPTTVGGIPSSPLSIWLAGI